jgi:uncharacterized protein (TIGR02246 family)
MGMRNTAWASLFLILAASGARADDLSSVQALNDGLAAAFNSGDSGRLAQLYAEDAVLLPPGAALIKGKQKIEGYYQAALPTVTNSKFSALESKSLGDADILEAGTFTAKAAGAHSKPIQGKFVILWRKVATDWKIATDIWNVDK